MRAAAHQQEVIRHSTDAQAGLFGAYIAGLLGCGTPQSDVVGFVETIFEVPIHHEYERMKAGAFHSGNEAAH
jgi:hypothetical protein